MGHVRFRKTQVPSGATRNRDRQMPAIEWPLSLADDEHPLLDDKAHFVPGTLTEAGLQCEELTDVHRPGERCVYVVASAEPFGRVVGKSNVLYVGHGQPTRVSQLANNTHSATRALRRVGVTGSREIQICWRRVRPNDGRMEVSALAEAALLEHVAATTGEIPPCNLRWEGHFAGRMLTEMIGHVAGSGRRRVSASYDWPASLEDTQMAPLQSPGSTWCDLTASCSLGWIWPNATPPLPGPKPGKLVVAEKGNGQWTVKAESGRLFLDLWSVASKDDWGRLTDEWLAINTASHGKENGAQEALVEWVKALTSDTSS